MEHERCSRDEVASLLHRSGISLTRQRLHIAHAILSRAEHLTADQLLALANGSFRVTSRATLYNTLKLLVDRQLIREVIVDSSRVFYDPNTAPHYHFYDVESGRLTDIDAADVRIQGLPEAPYGLVADAIDLIIRVRPSWPVPDNRRTA